MNSPFSQVSSASHTHLRQTLIKARLLTRELPKSPLSRVLHYWKSHPHMRLVVGSTLVWGGLIATATGAFATAGIILGARASITALGAFTSSKGLYEMIRGRYPIHAVKSFVDSAKSASPEALELLIQKIESEYAPEALEALLFDYEKSVRKHAILANIIGITTASVAGILALQGSEGILPAPTILTHETPLLPQKNISEIYPLDQIADDIRHDHPKQNWISLEQMIRRVEGLRMGISLDESEKLVPLNASISQSIHDPQGVIAQILKDQNYPDQTSIDAIARHLNESEIKHITEAYIAQTSPSVDLPLEETVGISPPPSTYVSWSPQIGVIGGSMILGTGGYLGYRWLQKNPTAKVSALLTKKSQDTSYEIPTLDSAYETIPQTHVGEVREIPLAKIAQESTIVSPPQNIEIVPDFELSESGQKVQKRIHEYFETIYGWEEDIPSKTVTPDKLIDVYQGTTMGWAYQIYVTYTASSVQTTIVWYDHNAARSHVQSESLSYAYLLHPLNPAHNLESQLDKLYLQILKEREVLKSEDMKHIHSVRLPRAHLKIMYDHMESPKVRDGNLEVLGFWMGSAYHIQNHTLPLDILANPKIEDQCITGTSCRPRDAEVAREFYLLHPNDVIEHLFPQKEAELILQKRLQEFSQEGDRKLVFSGAMRAINWHKHPDYLAKPSQWDIDEASRDLTMQYPGAETYPYAIAVRIPDMESSRLGGNSQVVVLPRREYWGKYNYAIRAYQLVFQNGKFLAMRPLNFEIK